MTNQKYEITDIAHEKYPFLHRIRALRNVGDRVKAGDLGGFVEHEGNLSFEPGDNAWIFGDAIAAGDGYVEKDAILSCRAIICGHASASHSAVLSEDARAEDYARIHSAAMFGSSKLSGHGMLLPSPDDSQRVPILLGRCCVYGKVAGDVRIKGDTVIVSNQEICNNSLEVFWINGQTRTVYRNVDRDKLQPRQQGTAARRQKNKLKEQTR